MLYCELLRASLNKTTNRKSCKELIFNKYLSTHLLINIVKHNGIPSNKSVLAIQYFAVKHSLYLEVSKQLQVSAYS